MGEASAESMGVDVARLRIEISVLSARYGVCMVLGGVTVQSIDPGTFTGVIGPNASGKSTLIKTLAGLMRPTAGTVHLGSNDIARLNRQARKTGGLHQFAHTRRHREIERCRDRTVRPELLRVTVRAAVGTAEK